MKRSGSVLLFWALAGPHRPIAVVADGAHVPLQPLVVDSVELVIE